MSITTPGHGYSKRRQKCSPPIANLNTWERDKYSLSIGFLNIQFHCHFYHSYYAVKFFYWFLPAFSFYLLWCFLLTRNFDFRRCRKRPKTRMFVPKIVAFIRSFFIIQLFISNGHFVEKHCFVVSLVHSFTTSQNSDHLCANMSAQRPTVRSR